MLPPKYWADTNHDIEILYYIYETNKMQNNKDNTAVIYNTYNVLKQCALCKALQAGDKQTMQLCALWGHHNLKAHDQVGMHFETLTNR